MADSIDERIRRNLAPTASSMPCLATRPGLPRLWRSASLRAIQSRSRVPLTFWSLTPSARATCTTSVIISRASRRTIRCRTITPSRSPARVPRVLMAQLMASLLQREPSRLLVHSTGPTHSSSCASRSMGASMRPSR